MEPAREQSCYRLYRITSKEAKRRALDEIAARQRAADEKRKDEAERQSALVSQTAVIQ